VVVITPAIVITLARSVSIGIAWVADDDAAFITLAPATAAFIADYPNVLNVALPCA
jgi:hypothetical protein